MAKKKSKTSKRSKAPAPTVSDGFDPTLIPDADAPLSSEEIDKKTRHDLAKEKERAGKRLSVRDRQDIRAWQSISEYRLRWRFVHDFTRADFSKIVQIDNNAVKRIAARAGLAGLQGRNPAHKIDLVRVVWGIFRWFKDNHKTIEQVSRQQDRSAETDLKRERALLQLQRDRMQFERESGRLVSLDEIDEYMDEITSALRDCMNRLDARYGPPAREIVSECIERLRRRSGNDNEPTE